MAQKKVHDLAPEPKRETNQTLSIIITQDQYHQLLDVCHSISGVYDLLKKNQDRSILPLAIASVLKPIHTEMWRVVDEIEEDPADVKRRLLELGKAAGFSVEFRKRDRLRLRDIADDLLKVNADLVAKGKSQKQAASLVDPIAKALAEFADEIDKRFNQSGAR